MFCDIIFSNSALRFFTFAIFSALGFFAFASIASIFFCSNLLCISYLSSSIFALCVGISFNGVLGSFIVLIAFSSCCSNDLGVVAALGAGFGLGTNSLDILGVSTTCFLPNILSAIVLDSACAFGGNLAISF